MKKKVGIIGGSGLDNAPFIEKGDEISFDTPYGNASSLITEGEINGQDVAILSRHGKNHSISPSNVNFRANIWSLKELGCCHIIATTAVGSLREEIKPGDIILPNQFIDFTKIRESTFFDSDKVVHTPMSEPFCRELIKLISSIANGLNLKTHENKTVITIEGPRFSTKAESHLFRQWGADIINMSTCPEAALANELGIKYSALAVSTDYDCWKEDEEPVSWEMIERIMKRNSGNLLEIIKQLVPQINSA